MSVSIQLTVLDVKLLRDRNPSCNYLSRAPGSVPLAANPLIKSFKIDYEEKSDHFSNTFLLSTTPMQCPVLTAIGNAEINSQDRENMSDGKPVLGLQLGTPPKR